MSSLLRKHTPFPAHKTGHSRKRKVAPVSLYGGRNPFSRAMAILYATAAALLYDSVIVLEFVK